MAVPDIMAMCQLSIPWTGKWGSIKLDSTPELLCSETFKTTSVDKIFGFKVEDLSK